MHMSRILFSMTLAASLALAGELKTQVLREGAGDPVRSGQLVQVHYTGWLSDSTQFDSSRERGEPLEFPLGMGQVIQGWDRAIVGMKVGEVRRMEIPPELGYGDKAVGPIPAGSTLIFEVELMGAQKGLEADRFPQKIESMGWKVRSPGLEWFDETVGQGVAAKSGLRVKVHYTGWLSQGRKFDSSKDFGKPLEGVLGTGKFIKGWEMGLEGLQAGTVRWLRVAPSLGYGPAAMARIPPNSTLVFRVEGVSVEADDEIAAQMDFFPNVAEKQWQEGPEGLKFVVEKQGAGEPATAGAKVQVHYTGWLMDGTKFDSSRDRAQPFEFPLGAGRVVRGWDVGVEGMLPGEKRLLLIPPGLGYGSRGGGPIPPDATLLFAVEYLGN